MNICIITSSYPLRPGDPEAAAGVFVRDFALQLARWGHEVHVVTQARPGPAVDDPELWVHRFWWLGAERALARLRPLHPVDACRIASVLWGGRRAVLNLVRRGKIDACLAMWALPAGYFAAVASRRAGVPYAVWALGSDIWAYERNPLLEPLLRRILRGADALYADGRELCGRVESLAARSCHFLASARVLRGTPGPLVLDSEAPHLLFVGRYELNKGVDILIDAMRLLAEEGVRAQLHVFGGGSLRQLLEERVRSMGLGGVVHIGGYADINTVIAYMHHCSFLVIPSRIESIPVVLSDALQMRIPVVATDAGDMGTLVQEYGVGEVVPAGDPVALKEGIVRALSLGREHYLGGMDKLAALLSVEASARTFLEHIERTRAQTTPPARSD